MFNQYPYINQTDLNLDYILKHLKEMAAEIEAFREWMEAHFVESFNTRVGAVVPEAGDYSGAQVTYDNTGSGLAADNVQDAIDEVKGDIPVVPANIVETFNTRTGDVTPTSGDYEADQITYDNTLSGLTGTDVQGAIDELAASATPELDDLGDVTITTPTNGQVLSYDSGTQEWVNTSVGSSTIAGLTDVTITSPQNGQVLNYDGVNQVWVNGNAGSNALASLSDVTITTPADGEVLTYDSNSQEWVNEALPTPTTTLGGLTDVTITSATDGEVLTYDANDQEWKNAAIPTPAIAVSGLSDVNLTGLADGQVLVYDANAQEWVNGSTAGSLPANARIRVQDVTFSYTHVSGTIQDDLQNIWNQIDAWHTANPSLFFAPLTLYIQNIEFGGNSYSISMACTDSRLRTTPPNFFDFVGESQANNQCICTATVAKTNGLNHIHLVPFSAWTTPLDNPTLTATTTYHMIIAVYQN